MATAFSCMDSYCVTPMGFLQASLRCLGKAFTKNLEAILKNTVPFI